MRMIAMIESVKWLDCWPMKLSLTFFCSIMMDGMRQTERQSLVDTVWNQLQQLMKEFILSMKHGGRTAIASTFLLVGVRCLWKVLNIEEQVGLPCTDQSRHDASFARIERTSLLLSFLKMRVLGPATKQYLSLLLCVALFAFIISIYNEFVTDICLLYHIVQVKTTCGQSHSSRGVEHQFEDLHEEI